MPDVPRGAFPLFRNTLLSQCELEAGVAAMRARRMGRGLIATPGYRTDFMDAAPADFRLLKFSSDEVPASVRFDFWRDIVTRKLLRLAIDPLSDAPFVAHANLRTLNGVSVGEGLIG